MRRGDELYSVDGDKQSKPQKLMIKCPEGYIYIVGEILFCSPKESVAKTHKGEETEYMERSQEEV